MNAKNRTMPLPRLFYKILYDPDRQAAIAFAGINNPYESLESIKTDVRCRDICDRVSK